MLSSSAVRARGRHRQEVATAPRQPQRPERARIDTITRLLLTVPLGFLAVFLLGPLVMVGLASGGLTGIHQAVTDPVVLDAFGRTLVIAAVVAGVTAVLGTAYALALIVTHGVGRALLVAALLGSLWVSILVRTVGWEILEEPQGMLDSAVRAVHLLRGSSHLDVLQTTAGMYPAMVNVMLAYMVLPVWAALGGLDRDQLRAARTLGARPLQVIRQVMLPQARSGIAAGTVLVFALSLGFYITPRLLGGPSAITIGSLVGTQFEASQTGDVSEPAAVGLLLIVAVLLLYAVANRLLHITARMEHQ